MSLFLDMMELASCSSWPRSGLQTSITFLTPLDHYFLIFVRKCPIIRIFWQFENYAFHLLTRPLCQNWHWLNVNVKWHHSFHLPLSKWDWQNVSLTLKSSFSSLTLTWCQHYISETMSVSEMKRTMSKWDWHSVSLTRWKENFVTATFNQCQTDIETLSLSI